MCGIVNYTDLLLICLANKTWFYCYPYASCISVCLCSALIQRMLQLVKIPYQVTLTMLVSW